MTEPVALRHRYPAARAIPLASAVSLVLLLVGVLLPAMTFEKLIVSDDTFSVLTGIVQLLLSGNVLLAALLLAFSVVFPAVKVITILRLWYRPMADDQRRRLVHRLEVLGKWSVLDTFVVAVLIGTIQLGILAEAVAEAGIYVYFVAILLSLLATFRLEQLVRAPESAESANPPQPRSFWLTLLSATLYGVGLSLPLMTVERFWWENQFSLLTGTAKMWARGDVAMALIILLFVVAIPSLRFATLLFLRLRRSTKPAPSWLTTLDRWSMVEVFVLATVVVLLKVSDMASASPGPGMWLLLGAVVVTGLDSWLLRRRAK